MTRRQALPSWLVCPARSVAETGYTMMSPTLVWYSASASALLLWAMASYWARTSAMMLSRSRSRLLSMDRTTDVSLVSDCNWDSSCRDRPTPELPRGWAREPPARRGAGCLGLTEGRPGGKASLLSEGQTRLARPQVNLSVYAMGGRWGVRPGDEE